jgi:hypothetical protein
VESQDEEGQPAEGEIMGPRNKKRGKKKEKKEREGKRRKDRQESR